MRQLTTATLFFVLALAAATAIALPRPGTAAPAARAQTLDGKVLDARAQRGKIALIFYEDKDSTQQNKALKDAITQQGKATGHKLNVVIYAVADVSGFDWWPARGFVQDAIRDEETKSKTSIFLDWTGSFGKAFDVKPGVSNVVLLNSDNKVVLAHSGVVPQAMRQRILDEIRK
jgi:predicted transcriptional regulator